MYSTGYLHKKGTPYLLMFFFLIGIVCLFSKVLPGSWNFSKNCCQAILPVALSPSLISKKENWFKRFSYKRFKKNFELENHIIIIISMCATFIIRVSLHSFSLLLNMQTEPTYFLSSKYLAVEELDPK